MRYFNYFKQRFCLPLLFVLGLNFGLAQNLNITSSGGETGTSGTNWSITGTTLTVTGTANIRASVIVNALNSGSLTIVGNTTSFTVTQSEVISIQTGGNLTIGNTSNTGGAININANISIGGNLSVYGRNVIANANLTSAAGNILLDGDRGSQQSFNGRGVQIETNREVTANNGSITLLGRGGNNGSGFQLGVALSHGSKLNTTTGNITITGIGGASGGNSNFGVELGSANTPVPQVNTSGGNIIITGTAQGTGSSNNNDNINIRGANLFSGSGSITLNGGLAHRNTSNVITSLSESILLENDCIFGHATNQSGPITFIGELFFNGDGGTRQLLTSGGVVIEPHENSFATTFNYRNFTTNVGFFRIGKTTNTANIDLNAAISAAGSIDILGGNVTINANITSSANGDIFIKGIGNSNPCISVNSGRTINKSAGTGTLTLQGHSRVTNSGTISATGMGVLNLVMWSDFDNSNNDGGVSNFGTISTNGGHVWLGGSNTNGGSYTWNGLTVGDGPSIGSSGYNANALDFTGSISTSNGHVFVWSGNGPGINGIGTSNAGNINAGTGNITLMSDIISGTLPLTTSGTISLVPNDGSYASALTLAGSVSSGNLIFDTSPYNGLRINNINSVGGFTIGRTEELLSSGTPVVFGNSSNVTISSALSIAGPINVYGGAITANANLTSTAATGTGIFLNGKNIIQNVGVAVTTSGADIDYLATDLSTTSAVDNAIKIGLVSGTRASINAGGGNVSLTGSFGTSSIAGETDYGIWLFNSDVITSGTGSISLTGDATNTLSTASVYGISMGSTTLKTASGAITLNGTGGKASNNSRGIVADMFSNKIVSVSGAITLNEIKPIGLTGTYTGFFMKPLSTVNTFIGADGTEVASSSSSVTIKADRASFEVNGTYRNNINTSGTIVLESVANIFEAAPPLTGLTISGNPSSLRIGKTTNTANITLVNAITTAGPIEVYGGNVFAQQNLTSTLSGAAILLEATGYIDLAASRTIQTNNGDITFRANSGGTAVVLPNSTTGAITLNSGSSLLSNGGNITLGGNFDGTKGTGLYAASARVGGSPGILINVATLSAAGGDISIYGKCASSYDDGIRLQANITTTGSGNIGLYGDAHGGYNGTQWFGGISFLNAASRIETVNGNVTLKGFLTAVQSSTTYGINFYRQTGSSGLTNHIQILSQTGNILVIGDRTTTSAGGIGHSSWGNIYFGSPANNAYTAQGNITLVYSSFVGAGANGFKVKTTGAVTYEPTASSFVDAQTFPHNSNYVVADGASSLTIGKASNTSNINMNAATTVAGPITVYGGDIAINENLNTTAGTTSGNVLIKASGDLILAANKSITTSGAPVVLWANSDNEATNGSIALRNGSSIVTGSGSVAGGHVWLGGGSDGTTWNGLGVGSGYAVPGTIFTPSNGGGNLQSGIYLERNSISSFGGNIKIAGDGAATTRGIVTYGNTININAGSGEIELDGQVTSTATGNRGGILFGLHDLSIVSTVNISSSATSGDAITINGVGRGTEDAIGLSGTLNITSSGGGNIVMNGNALGSGRSIVVGNYYHGILNIFANSGNISLNGNTKAVQVAAAFTNGLTSGPSKINIGQGGTITSSSSDVFITADNIALAAGGIAINASGKVTIEPASNSFASAITFPITNLSIANTITGLTLGKPTNNQNITFGSATSIAGPITAYGGTITLNADLTTTNNGDISLYTDNPIAGLGTPRTLTAAGAFKYIPRTTTFSADVTYPIANLTATSTGLTIGNATNDKNITIDADVTGGAGIELYGNNVNINSNLTTTGTSAIMHLKGNTTIAAGKTITSGGNFTHDGNLTFKSDVNGTAAFGTLGGTFTTVSGLATTERYVPSKRGWRLLTAPLKGATNATIPANWQGVNDEGLLFFSPSTYQSQTMTGYTTGGGMPNIWKYDSATTQWQSIPNLTTENLFTSTGNNGFLVFATGPSNSTNIASGATETTLRPEGQLITGNVTHSLSADKYHLIGNPYASPLHTEAMVQANANTKVFMVDPTLGTVGGYVTYDGSNWTPTPPPSGSEKYIQSGQGFFVRSTSNTTFTITESDKVVGNSNTWFARSGSNVSEDTSTDKIRVLLYKQVDSQWQLADGILAVNSTSGNNEVDATDTGKMTNFNENIAFRNGTSTLAIEYRGLPTIGTIQPMRLTGTTVQPYQLRVKTENYSNSDLQPYVEDTQTGVLTLIPIDGSEVVVNFTGIAATSSNPDSRFRIVYPATLSSDDPTTSLSVGIYPNPVEDKMFTIVLANQDETTQYTLTNLLGQQVQQGKLDTLQNTVSVVSLQGGVYVLQVVQSGKTFTSKLIIK